LVFFDGTNNNMKRDEGSETHSNIARLCRAFPGGPDKNGSEAWPDLKSKYHNSFFAPMFPVSAPSSRKSVIAERALA
jgi:hypothetical protein